MNTAELIWKLVEKLLRQEQSETKETNSTEKHKKD